MPLWSEVGETFCSVLFSFMSSESDFLQGIHFRLEQSTAGVPQPLFLLEIMRGNKIEPLLTNVVHSREVKILVVLYAYTL